MTQLPLQGFATIPSVMSVSLRRMLDDVAAAARDEASRRDRAVATVLARYLPDPMLLAGIDCPCCPDHYARYLLRDDPNGRHAVVAIVWAPGQMSPVHGHRTWCAFGVHEGLLVESLFRVEACAAVPVTCAPRRPGDVCHTPADPAAIHRIANLGTHRAISLHVYGVPFDSFGKGINVVWAA